MRGYQYIGPISEGSWRFGLSRRKHNVIAQRLENGVWKTHGVLRKADSEVITTKSSINVYCPSCNLVMLRCEDNISDFGHVVCFNKDCRLFNIQYEMPTVTLQRRK